MGLEGAHVRGVGVPGLRRVTMKFDAQLNYSEYRFRESIKGSIGLFMLGC